MRVSGPVEQGAFLQQLGIHARMAALLRGVNTAAQAQALVAGFERLVLGGDANMGAIYKVRRAVGGG